MNFKIDILGLFQTYKSLLPMKAEDEDRLWQKFRLDWNFNSNRIEGNTLTYKETKDFILGGLPPEKPRRHVMEMKAHDLAISTVLDLIKEKRALTEVDVRNLNQIVLKEPFYRVTQSESGNETQVEIIPGKYKTQPNNVLTRTGEIHEFVDPFEVPARMEKWVASFNAFFKKNDAPTPEFLARSHHEFTNIHPFGDGNGRTSRLLLNLLVMKFGWPPIIIKDAKKEDYYTALEMADNDNFDQLEALLESEILWSLQKSVIAARGEDIEDADDIDKEISQFVRENAAPFGSVVKTTKTMKSTHLDYTVPILKMLEARVSKFEPMFETFTQSLKADKFKSAVTSKNYEPENKVVFALNLKRFKSDKTQWDLHIPLIVEFGSHEYNIRCEVSQMNAFSTQEFIFPLHKYSQPFNRAAIESYTNKIGRAVFNAVKSYQEQSLP